MPRGKRMPDTVQGRDDMKNTADARAAAQDYARQSQAGPREAQVTTRIPCGGGYRIMRKKIGGS